MWACRRFWRVVLVPRRRSRFEARSSRLGGNGAIEPATDRTYGTYRTNGTDVLGVKVASTLMLHARNRGRERARVAQTPNADTLFWDGQASVIDARLCGE